MFRGLYGASSAMLVQEKVIDVASNNLANVDTAGFKRRISVNKAFPEVMVERREAIGPFERQLYWPIGSASLNVVLSETTVDPSAGQVVSTDNPLDVAIAGRGFFPLRDGAGNVFYSRAGNFTLDANGFIVNQEGLMLLGDGGAPINVGDASSVAIDERGTVVADGEILGAIQLFDFENPTYLRNYGKNLFQANEASGEPVLIETPVLVPGALEKSNVNVVHEMVRLIEGQRAYEASARMLAMQDEQTGSMISTFGR